MSRQLLGLLFSVGESCPRVPVLLSRRAGLQLPLDSEAEAALTTSRQLLTHKVRGAWLWDFVAELDAKPSPGL